MHNKISNTHLETLQVSNEVNKDINLHAGLKDDDDDDDMIYKAVLADDVNLFRTIYQRNEAKQEHYLGGDFQLPFSEVDMAKDISFVMIYNVTRLFHLAVCKSKGILKFMIEEGAEVTQVDRVKNNALHCLALMTHLDHVDQKQSVEAYNYLVSLITRKDLETLLYATGKVGARPIELAANFNCGALFQRMMNTPGVYLVDTVPCGIYDICWYDVTDYEDVLNKSSRSSVSPIYLLSALDQRMLSSSQTSENFSSSIFQNWATLKFRSSYRYFTLLLLWRISFVISFLLFDMLKCSNLCYSNYTHEVSFKPFCMNFKVPAVVVIVGKLYVLMLAFSLGIVSGSSILDHHHKRNVWIFRTPRGPKKTVVSFMFQFVAELNTALFVTLHESISLVEILRTEPFNRTFMNLFSGICVIHVSLSLIPYIEFFPTVGFFIITMRRMIVDITNFLITCLLFSLPFVYIMSSVINIDQWDKALKNETFQENTYFTSYIVSHYSIIQMVFNMINIVDFEVTDKMAIMILHVLFLLVAPIMLLNMLIAVFSTSVGEITEHKTVILTAHRLSIVWILEKRMNLLCPWFLKLLYKDTFFYKHGRKCFRIVRVRKETKTKCALTAE